MNSDTQPSLLRRATPGDAVSLAALGAATFTETFGHLYPREDLSEFLLKTHSVEAWTGVLADAKRGVWLALHADGTPMGFVAAGACKLPVENLEPTAGEIHQLYVLGKYHNAKLGTRLMECALPWLQSQGRTPLYIGVWSENFGGQRFYARFGFEKVGEYGFVVGKTVDHEFILKRSQSWPA